MRKSRKRLVLLEKPLKRVALVKEKELHFHGMDAVTVAKEHSLLKSRKLNVR
jgi:hypothetical protein